MSELVSIDFKMPDMLKQYTANFKKIVMGMAEDIQTNRGLLFDHEGAFNGHEKWKDLKSGKNLKIAKNGLQERNILRGKTGALRLSLAPESARPGMENLTATPGKDGYIRVDGDEKNVIVRVGTKIKYAAIHDQGGVINWPGTNNGFGKGIKIAPHKIKIPKRNFTDWNAQDANNMGKFLKNLVDVLNGK